MHVPPPYEGRGQAGVKKGPLQRFIGRPPLNLSPSQGGDLKVSETIERSRLER